MNTPIFRRIRKKIQPPTTGSALRWLQRAGWMLLGLFVLISVLGRVVGVPQVWKDRLVRELSMRGLEIDARKVTVDPLGGLVARDLVVYRDSQRREERLRIGRVELNLNWLAWRKGEPILSGARLRDAHVTWPLEEGVEASARRVEASIEFRPGEIRLQRVRGQILGFDLDLQGRVGTEAGRSIPPQTIPMAKIWRNLEKTLQDLGGPAPRIQAEFNVELGKPEEGKAEILLTGAHNVWRGVRLREMELQATVAEGGVQLQKFRIGLERGEIVATGWADFSIGRGEAEYHANADLDQFSKALGNLGTGLQDLRSEQPPQITGKTEFGWKENQNFLWQNRLEIGEFRVGRVGYHRFVMPWVTDGKRWMVQGVRLDAAAGGSLELQLAYDGKADLKGMLKSDLDPKGLAPFFGSGAAPFWESLSFSSPPKIEMKITGAGMATDLVRLDGGVEAGGFVYKGVEMSHLQADYVFADREISVKNLKVSSGGGEATAKFTMDWKTWMADFQEMQSTLPVQKFIPIFGKKFQKTMEPYDFVERPLITLRGLIDLDERGRSSMSALVKTAEGVNYVVAGRSLRFTEVEVGVDVTGKKVVVQTKKDKPAKVWGGKVTLRVETDGEKKTQTTEAQMEKVDFEPFVKTYFGTVGYSGEFGGKFRLSGTAKDWRSWSGEGRFTVDKGVLPGMGAFAQAMNAPAEWMGLSDQNAEMDCRLEKGKLDVRQLNIESTLVVTTGHGIYDIEKDQLEGFLMRQNLRGPAGVPFFFVSQMFQYEGSGSLKNPVWKPRNFDEK